MQHLMTDPDTRAVQWCNNIPEDVWVLGDEHHPMSIESLLEVLGEDYVRTAWAKGLARRWVILRHAVRNTFIPTLTVIALEFGYLLGGAVITETIFAWPGVGRWLFLAVQARDFRAVQGGVLLIATIFVLVNLLADILYAWLDPRIRYEKQTA